jgi:glycosyltransferase involved in cell wall biosynthesis
MSSINVAHMFGSLNRGGTETLMLDALNSKDPEIFIIVIHRKGGDLLNSYISTDIPIFHLYIKSKLDILYFFKLRKVLKVHNVNIVHAHQVIDAFYALIACLGTKIKVIVTHHGFINYQNTTGILFLKTILNRVTLNIFVSKVQYDEYKNKLSIKDTTKLKVIHNGIDLNKFNILSGLSIREEFGISGNNLLIGSVGNFNSVRDQMTICKFLNLLNNERVAFNFIFVGAKSNDYPEFMNDCIAFCNKKGINDKVFFLGSRSDVPQILSQLDAFIYSTNKDTFGIAAIEPIIAGIPTLVNDTQVMAEITDNGKYAVLYKTKNEFDLLDKFNLFLQNSELSKANAKINAIWAQNKYSILKFNAELKKTYFEILGQNI